MTLEEKLTVNKIMDDIRAELLIATKDYPNFNSAHEGFAILLEETDELKEQVWIKQKNRNIEKMRSEAIQVASMAIRFVLDCCEPEGLGYKK